MTQAQRDSILEAIVYVDKPVHHLQCPEIEVFDSAVLVNYSQFFGHLDSALVGKYKIPAAAGKYNTSCALCNIIM